MLNLVVIRAQDIDRLAAFYEALGLRFVKHRHGKGLEHLCSTMNGIVFEIYPGSADEKTASTRLGFSVPSLANVLGNLRRLDAIILSEASDSPFGRRAVVKDFEGHKIELYEKAEGEVSQGS